MDRPDPRVDPNNQVILPIATAISDLFGKDRSVSVRVQVRDEKDIPAATEAIKAYFRDAHNTPENQQEDVDVFSMNQITQAKSESAQTFSLLLVGMAILSLAVGGIGIMNVMLVSVTERTREVGVRLAIGARQWDIVQQFLIEAVALSLSGGLICLLFCKPAWNPQFNRRHMRYDKVRKAPFCTLFPSPGHWRLMDVSGSMQAQDMKPNRLEASKAAARAFVEEQPEGVRIGVVSFSDNAAIVQAPTDDRSSVLAAINRLLPQRATAIGRGLLTSLDAILGEGTEERAFGPSQQFQSWLPRGSSPYQGRPTPVPTPTPNWTPVPKGTYSPAIIVLLSDGENNQFPPPLDIIDQVVDRGVRVFTVGLGSQEGIVLSNHGRSMRTRLDEQTLKKIAGQTDGQYFLASNEEDLRTIYANLGSQLVFRTEQQEITAELAAIAILLLLCAGALSLLWFNRVL